MENVVRSPKMTRYSPEYKKFYDDRYYYKDKEYKPSRRNKYRTNTKDPLYYINRRIKSAKHMEYKMNYSGICPSGWSKDQGWGALYKAWEGFIIRRNENDKDGMEMYAHVIRKVQQDIGIKMREFPELMKTVALEYARDPENRDFLEEEANSQDKEVEDLNTEDVLNVMLEQDKLAYELAGMQY